MFKIKKIIKNIRLDVSIYLLMRKHAKRRAKYKVDFSDLPTTLNDTHLTEERKRYIHKIANEAFKEIIGK